MIEFCWRIFDFSLPKQLKIECRQFISLCKLSLDKVSTLLYSTAIVIVAS